MLRVLTAVILPVAGSCFISVTYMAPGRDSKWVTLKILPPA